MRLLVVEDNEKLAASLSKGLQQEGYAVDVAPTLEVARTLLAVVKGDYDTIVLDRMLPDGDGLELCRSARAGGLRTPVLVLTARDAVPDRVEGLDAGADDYLVKPFSFEELTARVRSLLRRPPVPVPTVLRLGEIELNAGARQVRVRGEPVPLTAKEFALLELLMRHGGQVLTRDQIARNLWDQTSEAGSNVVEVHMRNLRRKLSQAGSHGRIETLRGTGYRVQR